MTLQETVADRARWLDTVKPGWAALVDTEQINMASCSRCILGWVFGADAETNGTAAGYAYVYWGPLRKEAFPYEHVAFSADDAVSFWLEEIAARLDPPVLWQPSGARAGVTEPV